MKNILETIPPYLPSALVFLAIIYLTCFPDPIPDSSIPMFPGADKVVHAIMFGGMFAALAFDYKRNKRQHSLTLNSMIYFAIFAIVYGGVIEITQQLMNIGRSGDIFDFIADTIGVVLAYFLAPPVINRIFR